MARRLRVATGGSPLGVGRAWQFHSKQGGCDGDWPFENEVCPVLLHALGVVFPKDACGCQDGSRARFMDSTRPKRIVVEPRETSVAKKARGEEKEEKKEVMASPFLLQTGTPSLSISNGIDTPVSFTHLHTHTASQLCASPLLSPLLPKSTASIFRRRPRRLPRNPKKSRFLTRRANQHQ